MRIIVIGGSRLGVAVVTRLLLTRVGVGGGGSVVVVVVDAHIHADDARLHKCSNALTRKPPQP